ncbi:oxidoreductase ptaK [Pseudocercospora fuligena]|uniref:Oxidoreductase ptaK n=1 Tax=Pseudocercospora fuligena TaxID=685502 RepID=A0A8H6RJD2_9PEZI|nr:oxidoreductase ptaK [Pseudocercospora fuligena]
MLLASIALILYTTSICAATPGVPYGRKGPSIWGQWLKPSKRELHDQLEAKREVYARQLKGYGSWGSATGSGISGNWLWSSYGDDTKLSPYAQSGYSRWGTVNSSTLPSWANWGGSGKPWGKISTGNANPYTSAPKPSAVRNYKFSVAHCDIKPDGVVTKGAVCINGQFLGPIIEANYGDTINVAVTNNLPDEGTSVHWHGFLQLNNCHNDGVPGVQQCPIAPGDTYKYTMKAELYGSSWYHTHYSAQYAGGAVGPIVIYGPSNSGYDVDVGPVMLHEWYRQDYWTSIQSIFRPLKSGGPVEPVANSNLIDGKMRFDCSKTKLPCETASYAKFNFTSGKNHKLRLMNVGAAAVQKFSIDNHTMQVVAQDYMPLKPYNTSMVALAVGQRADVIVFGSGKKGDKYWMRSNIVGCSLNDGVLTEARAVIYYQGADTKTYPSAPANQGPGIDPSPRSCANDPLANTEPTYPLAAATPDVTQTFDIPTKNNGTNIIFTMGNYTFRANFNQPLLWKALNKTLYQVSVTRNLWQLDENAKVARAIIYNYNEAPHPIHYHGHNMQILNVGMGKWDGTIIRPSNPQRRDVQLMGPGTATTPSFLVVQWDIDNPGVWPLHCHFAWHSSMGLVVNVVEKKQYMQDKMQNVAALIRPTCDKWNAWMVKKGGPLLTGIDSGLRKARRGK